MKQLSPNDLGITGTHQSGILVPKRAEILAALPQLDPTVLNPRCTLELVDLATGVPENVSYIHYNNRITGGTRDEFRITGVTRYLREKAASPGDVLVLETRDMMRYVVTVEAASLNWGASASDGDFAGGREHIVRVSRDWIVGRKKS